MKEKPRWVVTGRESGQHHDWGQKEEKAGNKPSGEGQTEQLTASEAVEISVR